MDGSHLAAQADTRPRVIVIGAGIGGLSAALRLAHAGCAVTILERQSAPGGKMRVVPSDAGAVDTGPTVLTLKREFDALFADVGARLEDHVTLIQQDVIARHFWPDGSQLDLSSDPGVSLANVRAFGGDQAARDFERFKAETARLFDAFDAPMMQAPAPSPSALTRHVVARPHLVPAMAPLSKLAQRLARRFHDPRLAQLFARYATYVGGSPFQSPALLALISEAEARGVWVPEGGMHAVAQAIAKLAQSKGAELRCNAHVDELLVADGRCVGVRLQGERLSADAVLYNGDPRALGLGLLGQDVTDLAPRTQSDARSLSAQVWAFAATPSGPELAHHNVVFSADSRAEWQALDAGHLPQTPTLYICAQDRGLARPPPTLERFEIILNAPPLTQRTPDANEAATCHQQTFQTLARFGLRFTPTPDTDAVTLPAEWEARFPGSAGSLYGQSPHGMMAAFHRPTARSGRPGLYLAGGGTHPGAGVPMATRSGKHAAEAILSDLALTSTSRPMAMPGGMSTG
ncbi:1-hydroxycarotenoid 3,4-desaturase CrtD [Pseudaestuariivita sp.]|uniref:1-hydroxycarotenoid 3,4-desaturase CrtD n=1 Tax=Pseudaestuariivita sp. TaxID=2211669 RepID=UPI00405866CB